MKHSNASLKGSMNKIEQISLQIVWSYDSQVSGRSTTKDPGQELHDGPHDAIGIQLWHLSFPCEWCFQKNTQCCQNAICISLGHSTTYKKIKYTCNCRSYFAVFHQNHIIMAIIWRIVVSPRSWMIHEGHIWSTCVSEKLVTQHMSIPNNHNLFVLVCKFLVPNLQLWHPISPSTPFESPLLHLSISWTWNAVKVVQLKRIRKPNVKPIKWSLEVGHPTCFDTFHVNWWLCSVSKTKDVQ